MPKPSVLKKPKPIKKEIEAPKTHEKESATTKALLAEIRARQSTDEANKPK